MFIDSLAQGFLDVDPQLIEMKTTVLLNLAVCYIRKKSEKVALDLLREVYHRSHRPESTAISCMSRSSCP